MLNVAIVGMGNIGNNHARVYQKRTDCKIVAVCDILHDRADKAAKACYEPIRARRISP